MKTSPTANQIANSGFSYDPNGNLIDNRPNTYPWDRANRLLSLGGRSYAYDGEGRRIAQTVSGVITKYLLDVQPGLAQVIAATTGASTTRYIHDIGGIQAMENNSGVWSWMLNDGQGSVRMVMPSGTGTVPTETRQYGPYGIRIQLVGSPQTEYGYTGEPLDDTGLIHLRARYYSPALGVFASLDPSGVKASSAVPSAP